MLKLIRNRKLRATVLLGCATGAAALAWGFGRQAEGDDQWNTAAALLDTINQSISQQLAGLDHHSHQRRVLDLPAGVAPSIEQTTRFARNAARLCSGKSAKDDWKKLECGAWVTLDKAPACGEDARCLRIALADFVVSDDTLFKRLAEDLGQPCAVQPRPEQLGRLHGLRHPTGPASINSPEIARHWLFCGAASVRGALSAFPGGGAAQFTLRWSRVGA